MGRALADRVGWELIDFDERIERREGRTIDEIFRDRGEPHFRALEAQLTDEVAERRGVILAPGGGWVTQPALVERLQSDSLFVWLRVRPATVHARWEAQRRPVRPLLEGADPVKAIASLLEARAPLYARADLWLDTDERAPEELAAAIEARLQPRPRRPLDDPTSGSNNSAAGGVGGSDAVSKHSENDGR